MSVTLHTDLGDLKLEIHCEECPKSAENFLAHCAKGTYNNTKVVRSIKGFIVQFGDPTHTGKGGASVWGGHFEDEFNENLRHSQRGILSMANTGPNTNASQFFITYGKHPALDGKYTVFGKTLIGAEDSSDATLTKLENLEVDKKKRPKKSVLIKSVTIHSNPIAERDE